jgi:transcriptional regulator with XRE-family HTH domain
MFSNPRLKKDEMRAVQGNNIRKYRNEKCYTQEYMASELGIGQSAYQKIESGEVNLSTDRLVQIASILGKPVEAFIKDGPLTLEQNGQQADSISKEIALMQKIILQQEKRIEELEAKVVRKDNKIEELKQFLSLKSR